MLLMQRLWTARSGKWRGRLRDGILQPSSGTDRHELLEILRLVLLGSLLLGGLPPGLQPEAWAQPSDHGGFSMQAGDSQRPAGN